MLAVHGWCFISTFGVIFPLLLLTFALLTLTFHACRLLSTVDVDPDCWCWLSITSDDIPLFFDVSYCWCWLSEVVVYFPLLMLVAQTWCWLSILMSTSNYFDLAWEFQLCSVDVDVSPMMSTFNYWFPLSNVDFYWPLYVDFPLINIDFHCGCWLFTVDVVFLL